MYWPNACEVGEKRGLGPDYSIYQGAPGHPVVDEFNSPITSHVSVPPLPGAWSVSIQPIPGYSKHFRYLGYYLIGDCLELCFRETVQMGSLASSHFG